MKGIALLALLLLASVKLFAQPTNFERPALPPAVVTATINTVSSTDTFRGINISSDPATSVIISTSAQYRQVCVQNFSTAAFLSCGESVSVSSMTSSDSVGAILPVAPAANAPASPLCFSVKAGTNFYCRNSSVIGTTRAGISRGR